MLYIIYLNIILHVIYNPIEHKFSDNIFTMYADNQNFEQHQCYITLPNSL